MVKGKGIVFGKLLSCVLVALITFTSVGLCYKKRKVDNKLLLFAFEKIFRQPIEIMYLLTNDFKVYYITSNLENGIHFKMEDIKEHLKNDGYAISDLLLIVHNHIPNTNYILLEFSKDDVRAWRIFRGEGFTGKFYLYIQGLKRIYILQEDKNDS